jgi:hypothetical protein
MERYCIWQLTYGAPKGRVPLLKKCGCSWNSALYIMRKLEKAPLQLKEDSAQIFLRNNLVHTLLYYD